MKNIEEIDVNLKVETKISQDGLRLYNPLSAPFEIYGVYMDRGKFRRLPEEVAMECNNGVHDLHADTAGGRIRFRTDSEDIAVIVKYAGVRHMPHFPLTGSAGFDLYLNEGEGEVYYRTFLPAMSATTDKILEAVHKIENPKMQDVTINMPLYSSITEIYIGLSENASVEAPTPYIDKKPVVYYGSSITQGGCASRPGNSYQAIISRRFNCDYINLGFSGSARAEAAMIEYIKLLDMSIFVYDYDHNAPNPEYLEETHEKMFKAIRAAHPELPIIMLSAPKWALNDVWKQRRDIVEKTYKNALAAGDKNVYFLDGKDLMKLCENNGTVDNVHPNDFGFASMAKAVGDVIEKIRE